MGYIIAASFFAGFLFGFIIACCFCVAGDHNEREN